MAFDLPLNRPARRRLINASRKTGFELEAPQPPSAPPILPPTPVPTAISQRVPEPGFATPSFPMEEPPIGRGGVPTMPVGLGEKFQRLIQPPGRSPWAPTGPQLTLEHLGREAIPILPKSMFDIAPTSPTIDTEMFEGRQVPVDLFGRIETGTGYDTATILETAYKELGPAALRTAEELGVTIPPYQGRTIEDVSLSERFLATPGEGPVGGPIFSYAGEALTLLGPDEQPAIST